MRSSRLVPSLVLAVLVLPSTAAAQRDRFLDALVQFHTAVVGVYGDEGTQLTAHLEAMSTALARWDAAIGDAEREWRPRLEDGRQDTALQVHTVLGALYTERSRLDEALREFDAAIRIDPKRAALHTFRGLVHQAAGRPAEAAAAFRSAWRLDPDDPLSAYRLLVNKSAETTPIEMDRALGTLAKVELELTTSERTRAQSPFISVNALEDAAHGAMVFAPASYARGFSLLLKGEYEAGIAAVRSAAALDSLVADAALRSQPMVQGIAALRQGRIAPALEQLESAAALAGDSSEVHRILGMAYGVNGDITRSVQHLREAVRLNPLDERSWLALARTLDDAGEWVEAREVLQKAIGVLPDSAEMRWQLSATSGKRQRTDASDLDLITTADRFVLLAGRGELYSRIAKLAQLHLDYDRAVNLLEQRVVLTPNDAGAHKALGRAYVEQGREDIGYAELVVALLLDANDSEALSALGRLHLTAGQYANAVEVLQRAVVLEPGDRQALHALGDALIRAGRTGEGQERLEESERLQVRALDEQRRMRTAGMLTLQAELLMDESQYDRAIEVWQQITALQRVVSDHLRLAEAFVRTKRLQQAADELQIAVSLKAGPEAHRRLAEVYAALGRTEESTREHAAYVQQRLQELGQGAKEQGPRIP